MERQWNYAVKFRTGIFINRSANYDDNACHDFLHNASPVSRISNNYFRVNYRKTSNHAIVRNVIVIHGVIYDITFLIIYLSQLRFRFFSLLQISLLSLFSIVLRNKFRNLNTRHLCKRGNIVYVYAHDIAIRSNIEAYQRCQSVARERFVKWLLWAAFYFTLLTLSDPNKEFSASRYNVLEGTLRNFPVYLESWVYFS